MSDTFNLNPLKSIWTHPKNTMRHILNVYPTRLVHTLAIAGAFTRVITFAINWNHWWVMAIVWFSLAIFCGLFMLYFFGGLLKWTGNWLGGKGTYQEVRSSIAWAQLPVVCFFVVEMLVLWIVQGDSGSLFYTSLLFVTGLWSAIILLCCLSEAQQFTFFRAFLNYVISSLILMAVLVIAVVIVSGFAPEILETSSQSA